MKKIMILIGAFCYNKGSEALVRGTLEIVKRYIPHSRITLCSGEESFGAQLNVKYVDKYIRRQSYYSGFSVNRFKAIVSKKILRNQDVYNRIKYKNLINECTDADLIIILGGDNYDKSYHMFDLMHTVNALLRKNSRAKMVMYDCSLDEKEIDAVIKEDFMLFDATTAREKDTYRAFVKAFPNLRVEYYPDPAFVMKPVETLLPQGFKEGNTIGINVSSMVTDTQYGSSDQCVLSAYNKMIEWILNNTDSNVIFIPHVMRNLDLSILRRLYEPFSGNGRVFLIENEDLKSADLKYIISKCSIFVGARTHSTIAAYSSCVPTLVLGYSVKSIGIARDLFGTEKGYVVPVKMLGNDDVLATAFSELYIRKDEVKRNLESVMPFYIQKAWQAGELFKNLMEEQG